jgi:hypothetical protein
MSVRAGPPPGGAPGMFRLEKILTTLRFEENE